jgi:hypothetical protein
LQHYAQVDFDHATESENEDDVIEDANVDLTIFKPRLQELATVAASGDMAASKKIIGELNVGQLGKQRHQQLVNALRQYDLEKVEKVVRGWLGE